jgi:hypothetical protein
VVTVVGVAYRGRIPLEDIKVDFVVEPVAGSDTAGFGVRKVVTLAGRLSERDHVRLERAAEFCPVGQALTKKAVQITDQVQWSSGETAQFNLATEEIQPLTGDLPALTPGEVHGRYLLDTREYDEAGAMEHEGEVKVYVTCENLTRTSRWTLLAGHSSPGWVPPPFPLSHAAWAASTVSTLSQLLPEVAEDTNSLRVEIATSPGGGRGQSQGNAAAGIVASRAAVRRVVLPGSPSNTPLESVQGALLRDPVSLAYMKGGVLMEDRVEVA